MGDVSNYLPSFIEALVGLLVFGVSLPTYLLQVPPQLFEIARRYPRRLFRLHFKPLDRLIYKPTNIVIIVVVSIIWLLGYTVPTPQWVCQLGLCRLIDAVNVYQFGVVIAIMVINLVLVTYFASAWSQLRLSILIDRMIDRCLVDLGRGGQETYATIWDDLKILSKLAEPGREKQDVLRGLEKLIPHLVSEDTIRTVSKMIAEVVTDGSEQNYIDAMSALESLSHQVAEGHPSREEMDNKLLLARVLADLKSLMIKALDMKDAAIDLSIRSLYDEIAEQEPNDYGVALWELGRKVADEHNIEPLGVILDKFDTKIDQALADGLIRFGNPDDEVIYYYFGFLAHYWRLGVVARQHVRERLDQLTESLTIESATLLHEIEEAYFFFKVMRLDSAENLHTMLHDLRWTRTIYQMLMERVDIHPAEASLVVREYDTKARLQAVTLADLYACEIDPQRVQLIYDALQMLI